MNADPQTSSDLRIKSNSAMSEAHPAININSIAGLSSGQKMVQKLSEAKSNTPQSLSNIHSQQILQQNSLTEIGSQDETHLDIQGNNLAESSAVLSSSFLNGNLFKNKGG